MENQVVQNLLPPTSVQCTTQQLQLVSGQAKELWRQIMLQLLTCIPTLPRIASLRVQKVTSSTTFLRGASVHPLAPTSTVWAQVPSSSPLLVTPSI